MEWIRENPARWDGGKARILGASPKGVFRLGELEDGELVPGEWWRVDDDGKTVGYGWMDTSWGDAEILLAVEPDQQRAGVGSFILEKLEHEARARGLGRLYNVVPAAHPEPEQLAGWLKKRRFAPSEDGKVLQRTVAKS